MPTGEVIDDYFVSVRPDVAVVFPVTPEKEVIFVRQYKHGIQEILLELPGGAFNSAQEPPEEAARREMREETGYMADRLTPLAVTCDNPTKDTNRIHLFLAENAQKVYEQELDTTENIEVVKIPLDQIIPMIMNGEIKVAGSIAISFLALEKLKEKLS